MKSVLFAWIAVFLIAVITGANSKDSTGNNRRVARGFRLGAADRFSHGFGKRTEGTLLHDYFMDGSPEFALPNQEFAEILRSSERLANMFVQISVDKNGDGYVTKDELLGYGK